MPSFAILNSIQSPWFWLAAIIFALPYPWIALQLIFEYRTDAWKSIEQGESYYFGNLPNFFLCAEPAYNISFAYAKLRYRNFQNVSGVPGDSSAARPQLKRSWFSEAFRPPIDWSKADMCLKFDTSTLSPKETHFAEEVYSTKLDSRLFFDVSMENFGIKPAYQGKEEYTDIYQGLDLWSDFPGVPNSRQWLGTVPISKAEQIQSFIFSKARDKVLPPDVKKYDFFVDFQQRERLEITTAAVVGISERAVPKESPVNITMNNPHIREPPLLMSDAEHTSGLLSFAKVSLTLSKHSVTVREQVTPLQRWTRIFGEVGGLTSIPTLIIGFLFHRKYKPTAEFEKYEENTIAWQAGKPMDGSGFKPLPFS